MTAPPVNSEEEYYMDEPFDDDSPSEVEEEQEFEEDVQQESDSQSETDVEAEFLRGNVSATDQMQLQELTIKEFSLNHVSLPQPHARRQQMFAKRSGGGSGFPRQSKTAYASSSSEDEAHVLITETVVEVNQSTLQPDQTNDETMSVRTLIPNSVEIDGNLTELEDGDELTEVKDDMQDEMCEEEQEVVSDNEHWTNDLASEHINEVKEDDVEIWQLNQNEANNDQKDMVPNQDLVDVADATESELELSQNTDSELDSLATPECEPTTKPQNKKRGYQHHPNLPRQPIIDADAPLVSNLPNLYDNESEVYNLDENEFVPGDPLNFKFLEQQMTQMSEMIMKTFRLNGGSADNSALEQLAMATKLMKQQSTKLSELDSDKELESMTTMEMSKDPTSSRSEKGHRSCRCPSNTALNEPEEEEFLMDECGQGDGLLRYPHLKQTQSARLNCRVSNVTPSSVNSDNTGYQIEVRRPRSAASSEVNYKNLGRKSFSFTNPQVREIERQNNILLKKMMNVKPTIKPTINTVKSSTNIQTKQSSPATRLTSAAVNRKKYQRQIDLDNDVLKRKLEAVGSRRPIFK